MYVLRAQETAFENLRCQMNLNSLRELCSFITNTHQITNSGYFKLLCVLLLLLWTWFFVPLAIHTVCIEQHKRAGVSIREKNPIALLDFHLK